MIDGIKILVKGITPARLEESNGIEFTVQTSQVTGEVRGRRHKNNQHNITYTHIAQIKTYKLTVFETYRTLNDRCTTSYNLIIEGSLHKNYYGSKNYNRFNYLMLQLEIKNLCESLNLEPEDCLIQNIEVGVNVSTPFWPKPFITNNMLMHSTTPFDDYLPGGKYNISIGRNAGHSHHIVKGYDKGLQYGLDYPLLRFEDRCVKMQYLRQYKIRTLADLTDYEKVRALGQIIVDAWDRVLVCDTEISAKELAIPQKQQELLRDGCNRDFWVRLHRNNPKQFDKQRAKFKQLTATYSKVGAHALIRKLIVDEIAELLRVGESLPCAEYPGRNDRRGKFTNLVKGKVSPTSSEDISYTCPISQPIEQPTNPDHSNLYIPHETTYDRPMQPAERPYAFMQPTHVSINPSDSLIKSDTMGQPQNHSEATTAHGHPLGHQTADEYDEAAGRGKESPEASIQANTTDSDYIDWLTARFLNKL